VENRRSSKGPLGAARDAVEHVKRLARLETELRTGELKRRALPFGIGAGLGVLALLLAPLLVVFLLAASAAALATVLAVWAAILIVAGILLVLVAGLAGAAAALITRATKGAGDGAA
jgi:hypothetical protein